MERLTERDEFGNADIIGVDSADLQLNLEYDEFNLVTKALNRLASYEDTGLTPEEVALFVRAEMIPVKVMKRAIAGIDAADQCDQAGHYDYELRRALKTVLEWYQAPVFSTEFAVSKRYGWIPKWWPEAALKERGSEP